VLVVAPLSHKLPQLLQLLLLPLPPQELVAFRSFFRAVFGEGIVSIVDTG